jgi:hypothetical protein
MEDTKNRITFTGVNPPHATQKFIERHILKWINREQSLLYPAKQASYTAHIDREEYRYYTCHIEIQIGAQEWSGLEEGRSIHEAVLNTIKRLKPKYPHELYRPTSLPALLEATA